VTPPFVSITLAVRGDAVGWREEKAAVVAAWETEYLRQLLADTRGNVTKAAAAMRVQRSALQRLLRLRGLRSSDFGSRPGPRKEAVDAQAEAAQG
jgi:DNA-binding NtrC family response regulator